MACSHAYSSLAAIIFVTLVHSTGLKVLLCNSWYLVSVYFFDIYLLQACYIIARMSAGDLHFYMRHSFRPFRAQPSSPTPQEAARAALSRPAHRPASEPAFTDKSTHSPTGRARFEAVGLGMAPQAMAEKQAAADGLSSSVDALESAHSVHAAPAVVSKKSVNGMMGSSMDASAASGSGSRAVHLRVSTGRQQPLPPIAAEPAAYASSTTSVTSTDDAAELQSRRLSGDGASTSGQLTASGWHPHDPEHLIVNGLGGAFLHPTHVFSPSRFVSGMPASPGVMGLALSWNQIRLLLCKSSLVECMFFHSVEYLV